tara:strand:+ start:3568 stop:4248 length:681 start_codon:yes stop_codon:yes gene_type:complete
VKITARASLQAVSQKGVGAWLAGVTERVGSFVGASVGVFVGVSVGARVGVDVGARVGWFVGLRVPPTTVGWREGAAVGEAVVGLAVGMAVGWFDGLAEGEAVGAFVGARVGATVAGDTEEDCDNWTGASRVASAKVVAPMSVDTSTNVVVMVAISFTRVDVTAVTTFSIVVSTGTGWVMLKWMSIESTRERRARSRVSTYGGGLSRGSHAKASLKLICTFLVDYEK